MYIAPACSTSYSQVRWELAAIVVIVAVLFYCFERALLAAAESPRPQPALHPTKPSKRCSLPLQHSASSPCLRLARTHKPQTPPTIDMWSGLVSSSHVLESGRQKYWAKYLHNSPHLVLNKPMPQVNSSVIATLFFAMAPMEPRMPVLNSSD